MFTWKQITHFCIQIAAKTTRARDHSLNSFSCQYSTCGGTASGERQKP